MDIAIPKTLNFYCGLDDTKTNILTNKKINKKKQTNSLTN